MQGFGKRLSRQRRRAELSMSALAERSGISKGYISQLESGNAESPSMDTVIALAQALGVTLSTLAFDDPTEDIEALREAEYLQATLLTKLRIAQSVLIGTLAYDDKLAKHIMTAINATEAAIAHIKRKQGVR